MYLPRSADYLSWYQLIFVDREESESEPPLEYLLLELLRFLEALASIFLIFFS